MYLTCDQRVTEASGLHRLGLDKDGAVGGSLAADQHHGGGPGGYRAGHQGRWCRHHGLAHPGDGHLAGQADDGNRIITRPDMELLPDDRGWEADAGHGGDGGLSEEGVDAVGEAQSLHQGDLSMRE